MNKVIVSSLLVWIFLLSGVDLCGQGIMEGWILDASGGPIPTAKVTLTPGEITLLSNEEGFFRFTSLESGAYELMVSMAGYEPQVIEAKASPHQVTTLTVTLSPLMDLDEVMIFDEHAKQEDMLSTDHLGQQELLRNSRGTFVTSLSRLPGIDAIQTGVGIAKPVIRGLAFNRVIVNDQGIKQEGQQWGADHGLEIDALGVSAVEILRGPASLQYGSDGLGGVINVLPDPIPDKNSVSGNFTAIGKSNNLHAGASAQLAFNRNDFWVSGRYTRQVFGDYRVPADTFVFQGFVLPLVDGYLKNTAGQEENIKVETGIRRKKSISRITASRFSLSSGLFSGAVGIPRSYALQPDGNHRDINLPSQQVTHDKIILNELFFLPNSHLNVNAGFQRNLRQEFGFPEFHNQPEIDRTNTLALQLDLRTFSGNLHYEREATPGWKQIAGLTLEKQVNRSDGWDFLLPDFETWRAGAFLILDRAVAGSRFRWNGGLRVDWGRNQSDFFQRYVWNSNKVIVDSLAVPTTNDVFVNGSGSLGMRYEWISDKLWLKANVGKSFRVPYPSETVSNGVHHGTFRHEQGNPELRSEQGYQLDLILDWVGTRFQGEVSTYFNYFDNFIYLGPSGKLSTLPEAGQIYRYQQNDVFYSGFEVSWDYQLSTVWALHQAIDYVWNYNLNTTLSLPFTPQPSILTELGWNPEKMGGGHAQVFGTLSHRYAFANGPNRVDRNERTTPAYQLIDASVGCTVFRQNKAMLDISLQGQNLLNAAYFNHLSRYRLINIPEQGRNVVVVLTLRV